MSHYDRLYVILENDNQNPVRALGIYGDSKTAYEVLDQWQKKLPYSYLWVHLVEDTLLIPERKCD